MSFKGVLQPVLCLCLPSFTVGRIDNWCIDSRPGLSCISLRDDCIRVRFILCSEILTGAPNCGTSSRHFGAVPDSRRCRSAPPGPSRNLSERDPGPRRCPGARTSSRGRDQRPSARGRPSSAAVSCAGCAAFPKPFDATCLDRRQCKKSTLDIPRIRCSAIRH